MQVETLKVSQEQTMNTVNYVSQAGVHNNGGNSSLTNVENNKVAAAARIGVGHVLHQEDDDDHDEDEEVTDHDTLPAAKRTKKTKGRVKIKMEFIDNKLRRYTTFSKRKTGIMKKAYELSTLTGTQVMLLVASETGHVYTFATRKLQPMITSESGKALIQTCLNSPDPPAEQLNHHRNPTDQRMSATGFEETELTYAIGEEDGKLNMEGKPMFTVTNIPGAGADVSSIGTSSQTGLAIAGTGHTFPMTTYLPTTSANGNSTNGSKGSSAATNFTMALSQGGFTMLPPGTPLPAGATAFPTNLVQLQGNQLQAVTQTQTPTTPTLYRLQQPPVGNSSGSQLLTTVFPTHTPISVASTTTTSQPSSLTVLSNVSTQAPNLITTPSTSSFGSAAAATPVMYQTPQGVVYATSPGTVNALSEGIFLNYHPSTSNSLSFPSEQGTLPGQPGAQPIHIAVPMLSRFTAPQAFSQGSSSKDTSKENNNNSGHLLSSGSKT